MAEKYLAYPEYKESGVEWLGEIPRDWMATELKRNCKVTDGSHHSPAIEVEGLPFVSVTDVGVNKINFIDSKKISDQSFERLVKEGCKPSVGDVLLTKDGTIGRACIVTEQMPDFVILSSLGLLTPSNKLINKYLYYYLISGINIDQMNSVIHGSALRRMTISKINDLVIAFPKKEEDQTQIANFLDYETAQIDNLIEKQQTLIQLLKEKRQAVISHAVTKGVNPDAPMKDSGVEWLGEVPEHWEVTKAKYVSEIFIPQRNKPELNAFEGCPWVTMEDMKSQYIDEVHRYVKSKAMKDSGSKVLKAGAVIASCVGNFGITSINSVDVIINQQLQAFQPTRIKPEYLQAIVALSKSYFELIGTAATLVYVNREGFENLPVILPTKQEQEAISEFINIKSKQFNLSISKAEQAIQLMQERRTALISAAVTGKIDVRDWQAPKSR